MATNVLTDEVIPAIKDGTIEPYDANPNREKIIGYYYTSSQGYKYPIYRYHFEGDLSAVSTTSSMIDTIPVPIEKIIAVNGEIRVIQGESAGIAFAYPDININFTEESKPKRYVRVYRNMSNNKAYLQLFTTALPCVIQYDLWIDYIKHGQEPIT